MIITAFKDLLPAPSIVTIFLLTGNQHNVPVFYKFDV